MSYTFLETPIEYLKGVGPKRGDLLRKELQISSFEDLLTFYPFRYIDKSRFYRISEINNDSAFVLLKGKIKDLEYVGAGRAKRLTAQLYDESGSLELVWFKGFKWLKDRFDPRKEYIVFGKPSIFNNRFNIAHPEIEEPDTKDVLPNEKFTGVYSSSEKLKSVGLGTRGLSKIVRTLIQQSTKNIPENLSGNLIQHFNFISREQAMRQIHFPTDSDKLKQAQDRLKFEELLFIQLRLLKLKFQRIRIMKGMVFSTVGKHFNEFYHDHLPFELTRDQKKVIKEIRSDLGSGNHMNRLLQGDVGSGKTLVAMMTMLIALDNGYQACFMAPTEILANQHFETFNKMLGRMDINIDLLTGSTKKAPREKIHKELHSGHLNILIGTHALIEEQVQFKNLGLVIIDEQHRFGVAQRARLWKKNKVPPHVLVMTATPIPRTLAMTVYGDLDVSVIKELPPGRKPVKTYHFYDTSRLKVFGFIRKQIDQGRQIYIVYPLIQESSKLDLKDLMDGYNSITREFPLPKYAVSIVHGQMKTEDKDFEMENFSKGKTQILVATTVIEVGVDIPNASVMVIENAERFGLSQLHQLRGRVGRGAEQSHCLLMTHDKLGHEARKRIETMVNTNDGFEIAEVDLKLRGPGEIEGTRQSGMINLKLADLIKDEKMLTTARQMAIKILEEDHELTMRKNLPMAKYLNFVMSRTTNWGAIS